MRAGLLEPKRRCGVSPLRPEVPVGQLECLHVPRGPPALPLSMLQGDIFPPGVVNDENHGLPSRWHPGVKHE